MKLSKNDVNEDKDKDEYDLDCYPKFTLTSDHHWSKNGKIVVIVYPGRLEFKRNGISLIPTPEMYVNWLITFFGCLIFHVYGDVFHTTLYKDGKRCEVKDLKEILETIYAIKIFYNLELIYGCKESVMEGQKVYNPCKPKTILDLLKMVGGKTTYRDLDDLPYYEYPDSVMFFMESFDRELYEHFGLDTNCQNNKYLVYYSR